MPAATTVTGAGTTPTLPKPPPDRAPLLWQRFERRGGFPLCPCASRGIECVPDASVAWYAVQGCPHCNGGGHLAPAAEG